MPDGRKPDSTGGIFGGTIKNRIQQNPINLSNPASSSVDAVRPSLCFIPYDKVQKPASCLAWRVFYCPVIRLFYLIALFEFFITQRAASLHSLMFGGEPFLSDCAG